MCVCVFCVCMVFRAYDAVVFRNMLCSALILLTVLAEGVIGGFSSLRNDAVRLGGWFLMFWRIIVPSAFKCQPVQEEWMDFLTLKMNTLLYIPLKYWEPCTLWQHHIKEDMNPQPVLVVLYKIIWGILLTIFLLFHFQQYLERKRCFLPSVSVDQQFQCNVAYIVNPSNNYTLLQYRALTNASVNRQTSQSSYYNRSASHEAVQIYPQRVSLKLRISKYLVL